MIMRAIVTMACCAALAAQPVQESLTNRVLRMSDSEQIAFVKAALDDGMPGEKNTIIITLARSRSSVVLPIIEEKIEGVLTSPTPSECFTRKDVDVQAFVGYATEAIRYAGNEQALQQARKLLKLDENRFDRLVFGILTRTIGGRENPFALAYRAFDIGDPAISVGAAAWAEEFLAGPEPDVPYSMRRDWAEALVDRYGGPPVYEQWQKDPIVSGMNPKLAASLREDLYRFANESWERRKLVNRILAMSDLDLIGYARADLDRGIPPRGQPGGRPWMETTQSDIWLALIHKRSSVVLPVIESKIEEVLKSPNPTECFVDKTLDPHMFLGLARIMIAEAGDVQALTQARKILGMAKDNGLVDSIFSAAGTRGNPFKLVYQGFDMADPELEKRIVEWTEQVLSEPLVNLPSSKSRRWAEALIERYGGIPSESQWARDPIVSRLNKSKAGSLHDYMIRITGEAIEGRAK